MECASALSKEIAQESAFGPRANYGQALRKEKSVGHSWSQFRVGTVHVKQSVLAVLSKLFKQMLYAHVDCIQPLPFSEEMDSRACSETDGEKIYGTCPDNSKRLLYAYNIYE